MPSTPAASANTAQAIPIRQRATSQHAERERLQRIAREQATVAERDVAGRSTTQRTSSMQGRSSWTSEFVDR
jgi:hypothetical protein